MKINSLILLLCTVVTSCKNPSRKLPYYDSSDFTPRWEIPSNAAFHKIRAFNLIDQKGNAFTEKNIEGKICVADFFFTSCPGICPKMTNNMSILQKNFINDENILLLSHSVTPESDSVGVLSEYAIDKAVQYNKWKLLTGEKEEVYNLGRKYYFVEEDQGENRDTSVFLHTENFVLIDKNRMIRGIYNGLDDISIKNLMADVMVLKKEE
jgi:protein SCO1